MGQIKDSYGTDKKTVTGQIKKQLRERQKTVMGQIKDSYGTDKRQI